MKIKEGFIKSNLGDECVVVPVGAQTVDFRGLITLNETGEFIWEILQNESEISDIVSAMTKEYDIDEATAKADAEEFVKILSEKGFLE
ncbi:MAG: PqqD family protein [Clostridia bacterium]|nr:PqqD family protein [Clostridia bacterium]